MLIFSTNLCRGQQATVIKKLDDGSFIVEIEGKQFRAVSNAALNDQARAFDSLQARIVACGKDRIEVDAQLTTRSHEVELLKKDVTLVEQQRDSFKIDLVRTQEDAKRNFALFMGERELRVESQQFIPHGKVNGVGGKILSFLDGPYGQATFKLVIPTAQFLKVMRQ